MQKGSNIEYTKRTNINIMLLEAKYEFYILRLVALFKHIKPFLLGIKYTIFFSIVVMSTDRSFNKSNKIMKQPFM
jgi:hypothetical protein